MAAKKSQQSSLTKLLVIGGVLVGVVMLFPSGEAPKTGKKAITLFSGSKKTDDLYTARDQSAQFQPIDASLKNSFVPLVTKKDPNGPAAANAIPALLANGETTWVYTGNMTVNGVPNALLENTANGDGVFLRPNQTWKAMRLVAVHEGSIEIEGPRGMMHTVSFNELTASAPEEPLTPLPPATIDNNNSANPANGGTNNGNGNGNGNNRRNRRQFADNGSGLSGPIGQDGSFAAPEAAPAAPQNFSNGNYRRNRNNNENNLN
ncbi:MAG: hypothetical protein GC165_13640 [Armatimonadetes bacterium]|nr:hypothetical protein [Armatimonadota bacterium]